MFVLHMKMSLLTEYYMKGIVSYFEYINEYGFMQWCYINGGEGWDKTTAPPPRPIVSYIAPRVT